MCGIVGYVGSRPAGPILIDGLRRLEYRGYDSAGIAVLEMNGDLSIHKRTGKLETLASSIAGRWPNGHEGIGHTRWATHGRPSDTNAHPHADCTGDVVVIHNGIVENYLELKAELAAAGHTFSSETDTEVIPHLLEHHVREGTDLVTALRETIRRLEGAHAIVAMSRSEPGTLVAARVGNAGGVVIGYGGGENFLASDLPALLPHTRRVGFLNDGEVAQITATAVSYRDPDDRLLEKKPQEVPYDPVSAAKGRYKHFMLKEIMEQPESILDTIRGRVQFDPPAVQLEDIPLNQDQLARVRQVVLVGMGTSLHSAMIGRHYVERIAGIPAEVDNASEYR
jgi:glucosamine--fructose-6-phosphate aminotransferase (isomerizing)